MTLINCLVVSNSNRIECLKLLIEQINEQHIKPSWELKLIIVNGGGLTKKIINDMKINLPYKFVDVPDPTKNYPIGYLRDIGNKNCDGDYICCFDDDDYYFSDRIMNSITELEKSNLLIAGCKGIYIYDYHLHKYFLSDESERFASNGTLCYKKEYLEYNQYNKNKKVGEEFSFLNDCQNEILQLDPKKMCILNSHGNNTFSKREILMLAFYNLHKYIKLKDKDDNIQMPIKYFLKYYSLFVNKEDFTNDVVILGGVESEWNPLNNNLGGSEQAIVNLLCELSNISSHKYSRFIYYGKIANPCQINNVLFKPLYEFNFNATYNNLIIWRDYGLLSFFASGNIKAKNVIYDGHDTLENIGRDLHIKFNNYINKYALKSYHHIDTLMKLNIRPDIIADKVKVIPNGVHSDFFNKKVMLKKIKNRFVYCNSYIRGLIPILALTWPIIKKALPDAEIHIMYGKDGLDQHIVNILDTLLKGDGIFEYGKLNREQVIEHKLKAEYHLYYNNESQEVDCISIKESYLLGCIPIISTFGVFKERSGYHYDFNFEKEDYEKLGHAIVNDIQNNNLNIDFNNDIIHSWPMVAKEWLNILI